MSHSHIDGRASQFWPMSPIGAPGGAGDGGTMRADMRVVHRPLEEALDVGGHQRAMRALALGLRAVRARGGRSDARGPRAVRA